MILVSPASLTGNIVRYFRCSCNVLSPTVSKNYGDAVSESLKRPELPSHFNELSDREQFEQIVLLRRRQLHFYYVAATARFNLMHYDALAHDFSMLRRKIYDDASWPWEGDNVTLKGYLIDVGRDYDSRIEYAQWREAVLPNHFLRRRGTEAV
jgi:hypothetical protein